MRQVGNTIVMTVKGLAHTSMVIRPLTNLVVRKVQIVVECSKSLCDAGPHDETCPLSVSYLAVDSGPDPAQRYPNRATVRLDLGF